jgi:hypothetical protein
MPLRKGLTEDEMCELLMTIHDARKRLGAAMRETDCSSYKRFHHLLADYIETPLERLIGGGPLVKGDM